MDERIDTKFMFFKKTDQEMAPSHFPLIVDCCAFRPTQQCEADHPIRLAQFLIFYGIL